MNSAIFVNAIPFGNQSVAEQIVECKSVADRRGLTVPDYRIYEDTDRRSDLFGGCIRLLKHCEVEPIETVIVADLTVFTCSLCSMFVSVLN